VNIFRWTPLKASLILFSLLAAAAPGWIARAASQEQKETAVAALEQDVKANPNNTELWLHLGFAYRKAGQIDLSQNAFEKAASLDPKNTDALFMLGLIYEKKHMTQDAQRVWKQYLDTAKDTEKRRDAEKHLHHLSQQ
jgi:cytochrome c-type biogenesis protein CcmH/NrfG